MATKQPTTQQLAYLDELKLRLQELRKRQETFMEETAEILRNISSDRPVGSTAASSMSSFEEKASVVVSEEHVGNIKQLIQRFEDLRETSKQFSDQPMPEELVGVDVRKLLKGYENLVVEGNILQKSWLLLKKTTESCARQSKRDEPKLNTTSSKTSSFAEQSIEGLSSAKCTRFSMESISPECYEQSSWTEKAGSKVRRQRFGALLQLLLRLNPLRKLSKKKKSSSVLANRNVNNESSSGVKIKIYEPSAIE